MIVLTKHIKEKIIITITVSDLTITIRIRTITLRVTTITNI